MLGSSHIDTPAYVGKPLSVHFNGAWGNLKVKATLTLTHTHKPAYTHSFWLLHCLRYLWIAALLALAPLEHIMAFPHIHAQAHRYKQAVMRHAGVSSAVLEHIRERKLCQHLQRTYTGNVLLVILTGLKIQFWCLYYDYFWCKCVSHSTTTCY